MIPPSDSEEPRPADTPEAPKPPGRVRWWKRVRFGMRTALVLVAVSAVILGRYANSVSRQREVVAEVQRRGGKVMYDYEWAYPAGGVANPASPYPAWLINAFGIDAFHHVTWIRIEDETFGDDDAERVFSVLDRVNTVGVAFCAVTDRTMRFFGRYPALWGIFIEGCADVTNAGLDDFPVDALPRLSLVAVRGTAVTPGRAKQLDADLKAREERLKAGNPGRKIEAHLVLYDSGASRMFRRPGLRDTPVDSSRKPLSLPRN